MTVRYALSNEADDQFRETLVQLAESVSGGRVCEIGGGANPALPIDLVEREDISLRILNIFADNSRPNTQCIAGDSRDLSQFPD